MHDENGVPQGYDPSGAVWEITTGAQREHRYECWKKQLRRRFCNSMMSSSIWSSSSTALPPPRRLRSGHRPPDHAAVQPGASRTPSSCSAAPTAWTRDFIKPFWRAAVLRMAALFLSPVKRQLRKSADYAQSKAGGDKIVPKRLLSPRYIQRVHPPYGRGAQRNRKGEVKDLGETGTEQHLVARSAHAPAGISTSVWRGRCVAANPPYQAVHGAAGAARHVRPLPLPGNVPGRKLQSAAGRTIMTTEPKLSRDRRALQLEGGGACRVRLIDCVGFWWRALWGTRRTQSPAYQKPVV